MSISSQDQAVTDIIAKTIQDGMETFNLQNYIYAGTSERIAESVMQTLHNNQYVVTKVDLPE